MAAGDVDRWHDAAARPEFETEAPFTAWPDYQGGYVVVDLRAVRPVAGPFAEVAAAMTEMDRLNAQYSAAWRAAAAVAS